MAMVRPSVRWEVQLTTGMWSDISADVKADAGARISYGITGNGPLDCVASTGEAHFTLKNDAGNSGGVRGYYSPLHASVRAGWTFGVPVQIVLSHPDDVATAVTSITRSGTTATVTTTAAHGYATGDYATISGATQADYNGTRQVTVTGGSTFTCTVLVTATTPATGTITTRVAYVKHRGRVRVIDPDPGAYGPQEVHVTSYDGMRDLAETDVRSVALQINASESTCVSAILDALPTVSQPVLRSIDTGVDTFPYAFDELGDGVKALSVIQDVCLSSFALAVMRGDGTFTFSSRNTRALGETVYTFADASLYGLTVPASLDNVYNLVRLTIPKKTISAAATEELSTLPTGSSIEIAAGATVTVWTAFTDPNDRQTAIGGASVVTALVSGTHYAANSAADGSGSNLSANITPTITPFASTAKWTLQNTGAVTAYITTLKTVGKALRNPGPQTYEASSTQTYGTRELTVNLRYQSDGVIAQSYATYLETQYNALGSQVTSIMVLANASSALLRQVLAREPGHVITVTEAQTGLAAVDAVMHHIDLEIGKGGIVRATYGLALAAPFQAWLLGTVGRSEIGETTRLGF